MTPEDILIVGAGPAGCAAAYDLARAGRRVTLLDKRAFPRHKACACGLTRKTLKALRYSVDPIVEGVCNEIVLQQASPEAARREVRVRTRKPICAMAVRETFDAFCLQQSLSAGDVTLRKIEGLLALRESADGIEADIATATGTETLRAAILIGADGSNGQTRRLAEGLRTHGARGITPESRLLKEASAAQLPTEPSWYQRGFALEAMVPYTALPARLPAGDDPHDLVFDFAPLPGGYGWLFPKGDHINIGVGAFAPEGNASNPGDPFASDGRAANPGGPSSAMASSSPKAGSQDARLKSVTRALLERYTQEKLGVAQLANITGQYLGMGGQAYLPQGRVLLAGDAAGLVDPLTGEGIHSALISGQAAAAAILTCEDHLEHVAATYAKALQPLQETLAFSHRAARAFYAEPERGFRVMRTPLLRGLVLKTYADGLPHTKLLGRLAKLVA